MKTSELYTCESCGAEFREKDDCRDHEKLCRSLIELTEHSLGLMEGADGRTSTFSSVSWGKWLPAALSQSEVSVGYFCKKLTFTIVTPSSKPAEDVHKQLLDYAISWLDRMSIGLCKEREELEKEVQE